MGVGLLVITIWLELWTSYSSSCHHTSVILSYNKTSSPRFTKWKMAVKTQRIYNDTTSN